MTVVNVIQTETTTSAGRRPRSKPLGHASRSFRRRSVAAPGPGLSSRVSASLDDRTSTDTPVTAPKLPIPAPREYKPIGLDEDFTLRLYLQEISESALLSPADEVRLAERIQCGDADARETMIKANLRLVVKIAKDFSGMGLPLLDMINEGNMGLMRAVERFDPTKGAKLSTYAAWWIKQSIRRALANQSKTIRLPVHLVDVVAKMRREALKLQEEIGREPTDVELAEALGMTARRVAELWSASQRTTSLDAPIGDDDDNRLADIVKDENAATAFEEIDEDGRHEMVHDLLEKLDRREFSILQQRFGLNGKNERTLEDIGRQFSLTRERIRQIEGHALRKLRKWVERREEQIDPDLEPFRRAA